MEFSKLDLDYLQIIDALNQGLIVIDRQLRIKFWNQWMEEHSQFTRDKIINEKITDIYPEIEQKGFSWKADNVFKLGNFAFFSQQLHHYLLPFPTDKYFQAGFKMMQQSVVLTPLRNKNFEVEYICVFIQDNTDAVIFQKQLEETTKQLEIMSQTDFLTQMSTRRHLFDRLSAELNRHQRLQKHLTVSLIDIDFFKQINDTHGHLCGDKVLIQISRIFQDCLRPYDIIGRYGGEEFCVVLPQTTLDLGIIVSERLRKTIKNYKFKYQDINLNVTISIGVTSTELNGYSNIDSLVKEADTALYEAKKNGRNRVEHVVL